MYTSLHWVKLLCCFITLPPSGSKSVYMYTSLHWVKLLRCFITFPLSGYIHFTFCPWPGCVPAIFQHLSCQRLPVLFLALFSRGSSYFVWTASDSFVSLYVIGPRAPLCRNGTYKNAFLLCQAANCTVLNTPRVACQNYLLSFPPTEIVHSGR